MFKPLKYTYKCSPAKNKILKRVQNQTNCEKSSNLTVCITNCTVKHRIICQWSVQPIKCKILSVINTVTPVKFKPFVATGGLSGRVKHTSLSVVWLSTKAPKLFRYFQVRLYNKNLEFKNCTRYFF